MTRKDYVKLAEALADARKLALTDNNPKSVVYGVDHAAVYIADTLAADNPRFDRERFYKACGMEG